MVEEKARVDDVCHRSNGAARAIHMSLPELNTMTGHLTGILEAEFSFANIRDDAGLGAHLDERMTAPISFLTRRPRVTDALDLCLRNLGLHSLATAGAVSVAPHAALHGSPTTGSPVALFGSQYDVRTLLVARAAAKSPLLVVQECAGPCPVESAWGPVLPPAPAGMDEPVQNHLRVGVLRFAKLNSRCSISLTGVTEALSIHDVQRVLDQKGVGERRDGSERARHYYRAAPNVAFVTFENEVAAKRAFLSLQGCEIGGVGAIEVKVRISNSPQQAENHHRTPLSASRLLALEEQLDKRLEGLLEMAAKRRMDEPHRIRSATAKELMNASDNDEKEEVMVETHVDCEAERAPEGLTDTIEHSRIAVARTGCASDSSDARSSIGSGGPNDNENLDTVPAVHAALTCPTAPAAIDASNSDNDEAEGMGVVGFCDSKVPSRTPRLVRGRGGGRASGARANRGMSLSNDSVGGLPSHYTPSLQMHPRQATGMGLQTSMNQLLVLMMQHAATWAHHPASAGQEYPTVDREEVNRCCPSTPPRRRHSSRRDPHANPAPVGGNSGTQGRTPSQHASAASASGGSVLPLPASLGGTRSRAAKKMGRAPLGSAEGWLVAAEPRDKVPQKGRQHAVEHRGETTAALEEETLPDEVAGSGHAALTAKASTFSPPPVDVSDDERPSSHWPSATQALCPPAPIADGDGAGSTATEITSETPQPYRSARAVAGFFPRATHVAGTWQADPMFSAAEGAADASQSNGSLNSTTAGMCRNGMARGPHRYGIGDPRSKTGLNADAPAFNYTGLYSSGEDGGIGVVGPVEPLSGASFEHPNASDAPYSSSRVTHSQLFAREESEMETRHPHDMHMLYYGDHPSKSPPCGWSGGTAAHAEGFAAAFGDIGPSSYGSAMYVGTDAAGERGIGSGMEGTVPQPYSSWSSSLLQHPQQAVANAAHETGDGDGVKAVNGVVRYSSEPSPGSPYSAIGANRRYSSTRYVSRGHVAAPPSLAECTEADGLGIRSSVADRTAPCIGVRVEESNANSYVVTAGDSNSGGSDAGSSVAAKVLTPASLSAAAVLPTFGAVHPSSLPPAQRRPSGQASGRHKPLGVPMFNLLHKSIDGASSSASNHLVNFPPPRRVTLSSLDAALRRETSDGSEDIMQRASQAIDGVEELPATLHGSTERSPLPLSAEVGAHRPLTIELPSPNCTPATRVQHVRNDPYSQRGKVACSQHPSVSPLSSPDTGNQVRGPGGLFGGIPYRGVLGGVSAFNSMWLPRGGSNPSPITSLRLRGLVFSTASATSLPAPSTPSPNGSPLPQAADVPPTRNGGATGGAQQEPCSPWGVVSSGSQANLQAESTVAETSGGASETAKVAEDVPTETCRSSDVTRSFAEILRQTKSQAFALQPMMKVVAAGPGSSTSVPGKGCGVDAAAKKAATVCGAAEKTRVGHPATGHGDRRPLPSAKGSFRRAEK